MGIGESDDEASAGASLASFVRRRASVLLSWLPLIADVIGATVATTEAVDALAPEFRAARARTATAELIATIAGDDSVVVVEDIHWIDEASRLLLESLCAAPDRRAAVVLTRRPGATSMPVSSTIELEALDDEHANRLLLSELPALAASDATLATLRTSAAGNPLYLVELARAIAISPSTSIDPSATSTSYPETIERLLAARIDQLPISGRELIRDASVLGSVINLEFASRVLGRADLALARTWEQELADLVTLDDDTVRFEHELVRVAAYQGLSVRRRRAVHERAGDVIEEWGDAVPIVGPVSALAFHASGSGLPERIVRWCGDAAEAAIGKGAMQTAQALLDDVVAAQRRADMDDSARCTTYRRLAFAAERAGNLDVSLDALVEATRLAAQHEQTLIAVDRARVLEKLGRYRAGLALTARAIKACPDALTAAHLVLARASIYNYRGQWGKCLQLCDGLLKDADRIEDRAVTAQAHLLAEWCCASLALPERTAHEDAALTLLTELDDSIGLANLFLNRGTTAWQESRITDAIADFRASSDLYQRAGDVVGAALADNNVAEMLTVQFRLDEAEALLENANRVLLAASYPLGTAMTISGLSRIASWRGNSSNALRLQSDALARFRGLGADDLVVDSLVRLIEIHLLADETTAALEAAAEAREALERIGDIPVLSRTLARLEARARQLSGDVDGARALLQDGLGTGGDLDYEAALSSLAMGRLDGDDDRVEAALTELRALGVLAPPPGS